MATKQILSPLPGTFYRRPAPDKPAYKEDGDTVATGEVDRPGRGDEELLRGEGRHRRQDREVPRRERGRGAGRPALGRGRGLSLVPCRCEPAHRQSRRDRGPHHPRRARARHPHRPGHSAADADSLAVQLADEAVEIGPPQAAKSYLNIAAILDAAQARAAPTRCIPATASWPRMPAFAEAVEKAGLIFVGPSARDDPPDGRQGRGAQGGDRGRRADRARQRRADRRSERGARRRRAHRLSGDDQGGGRRRRTRHPHRPRRRRVRAADAAGERRGAGRLRRRRALCREG